MKTITKHRLRAFKTHFEIACLYAELVIISDFIWLLHDITHYGLKAWYAVVAAGLITGFIGTAFVIWNHNANLVQKFKAEFAVFKSKKRHRRKLARIK